MSYEKQTWQTGDVVTSAKLNHMEDGIAAGGGALVVNLTLDAQTEKHTCDKTAGQIYAAAQSGPVVFYSYYDETSGSANILQEAYASGDSYEFTILVGGSTVTYSANTADDYPAEGGPK